MRRILLSIAAVAAAAAAGPAAGQLYKQVGPDGRVTYSDRPPIGGRPAQQVSPSRVGTVSGGASATPAGGETAKAEAAPQTAAEREQAFRKRRLEADERAQKDAKLADEQRAKQQNCAEARNWLAGLQSGQRVSRLDAQGERVFLDDAQIQQEMGRAQKDVATWCN